MNYKVLFEAIKTHGVYSTLTSCL